MCIKYIHNLNISKVLSPVLQNSKYETQTNTGIKPYRNGSTFTFKVKPAYKTSRFRCQNKIKSNKRFMSLTQPE